MKGFDDIVLEWDGTEYRVPADRQMELILRVESALLAGQSGGQAFHVLTRDGGPPLALLARVWAEALSYAGARVAPLEVFHRMTGELSTGEGGVMIAATQGLLDILNTLAPDDGAARDAPSDEAAAKKR